MLIFVHGFNNTLSDAVPREPRFVETSYFGGVPNFFSCAAAGRISDSAHDLNSVLAARPLLEETSRILVQSNASDLSKITESKDGTRTKYAASPEVVRLVGRTLDKHGFIGDIRPISLLNILETRRDGNLLAE